ncbi:conserved hypothetical protein [Leishmania major strain Friedlin]|uniref:Uncharacterized protein n=1 Tax=Leishmania major TaxID=5664 RepID=Q4QAN5_LEIMA|nr:conserved hypothetical protein [Leishmania major strain Friedlin]CAG9574565.1 hypothetical_protein_-_conserved [Leishmania major strain Friedlin]CAJ04629.1 conserved hypothetical protein [Leishmania major strain Friedlin]|eukprot:XP_001683613.1 conserved hypothetical protein [Leishmania major strain Friedlin]
MFATTSLPSSTSSWRHHVQNQEEDLVRELMQASNVDAVLARMEGDHFRHLSPIMRKLTSFDPDVSPAPAFPRAGAPPPPPPPPAREPSAPRTYGGGFGGSVGWDAQSSQSILQPSDLYVPRSYQPASPASTSFHLGMRDGDAAAWALPTARQPPPPPPMRTPSSSAYGGVARDLLDAYRRPAGEATAAASHLDHEMESRYQTTIDSWLCPDAEMQARRAVRDEERPGAGRHASPPAASQQLHADPALEHTAAASGMLPPPTVSSSLPASAGRYHGSTEGRLPHVTTRVTSASPHRPSASLVGEATGDVGGLENAAQSRIARQLQLLRNYRQLAELCSRTDNPSTDLFRALPSEELARMQVEQLKGLAQREQSPITVNNNYYFNGSDDRHGSSRRGRGVDGGRSRGSSDDPFGVIHGKPNTGMAPGDARSVSEVFTGDSHLHGVTGYRPSGAFLPHSQRPPLLHSPRAVPLQSPQPSSGPDSPVATPPLSQRGGNLAPPSPSRSQRGRSHGSRLFDAHYTPTATTEEAGSSYDEGNAEDDDEDDYAGDCMDNGGSEDEEYDDTGTGYRRPPPRIIEREQHRRFHNVSNGDDASPSSAAGGTTQPPLAPTTSQLEHQRHSSYSGDYVNSQSLTTINEHVQDASNSAPPRMCSGSAMFAGGGGRNSTGGGPGSDGGRYSVSSAINVLSGDQELRANAQRQNGGSRGSHGDRRTSQHLAVPSPRSLQQQRRSLSTGSSPVAPRGGGALTDPEVSPSYLPLHDPCRANREREGSTQGSLTSVSRRGGNTERRTRPTPTPEKSPTGGSGTSGATAPCPQGNRQPKERGGPDGKSCSLWMDGAWRRGRRRGADANDDSNSDDHDVDSVRSGTYGSDSDDSACDTPGNPQLQTHRPRSSAQRQRHTSRRHGESRSALGRGKRGSCRRGYEDRDSDDAPTPRGKVRFGRKHSSATTRAYPTQRGRRAGGDGGGGSGVRRHDADGDGVDNVRSAASYSCSYTTSSDISDYVPGSYYSPIRSGHLGGGRRGARGGMINPGRPLRASTQLLQPHPSSIRSPVGVQGRYNCGGREGATQVVYGGRGRGGAMLGPRQVGVPGASASGASNGNCQSLGSPGRYPALAGSGLPGGDRSPYRGGGVLSHQRVAYQQQQRLRGGLHPAVGAGARGPSMAMAGGSAGLVGGLTRLPDGRVVPVASPEARWYQQAMRMMAARTPGAHTISPMKMEQPIRYNRSPDVYPTGLPYAARLGGRPFSVTPSPVKVGRAASPSVAASVSMTAHSNYGAGDSSAHIQPGLLYGSLLPKARPKTAMVVKEEQGRSHSVDPYGDASHAPLLDRGSVCPVQPVPSNGSQPWCLGSGDNSEVDAFPIAGVAVNGSASTSVLPLAWKSSGSGRVVSRTGHVPVAPRGKLSSHYVPPGSLNQRNQPQQLPSVHPQQQPPRKATVTSASSPAASLSRLPSDAARPTVAAASVIRKPSPQKQQQQQQQQRYQPLNPTDAKRNDSVFSLQSSRPRYNEAPTPAEMYSKAIQSRRGSLGGANTQQRYVPFPETLESAKRSRREAALPQQQQQQSLPNSSKRTAAVRSATLQHFRIRSLQGYNVQ